MASSLYVYRSFKDYERFYPKEEMGEPLNHSPLIDMYIKEDGDVKKLWVITNTAPPDYKPELWRSLVHFRNGNCKKWSDGTEKLVKHDNIYYDFRNNHLVIEPRFLMEPYYWRNVDRFVGKVPKSNSKILDYVNHNVKINYDKRFYDYVRDRINLIIEEFF